jgi:outer membrane protein TolC
MAQFIEFVRMASYTYWAWVAAGRTLEAERGLLKTAQERVNQINERVNAGDLPRIARINNEQLIAKRETLVIKAERKLQETGIKLSLFLRDDAGKPIIPDESQLPSSFPEPAGPDPDQIGADIARAITARPELAELNIEAEKVRVEMAQAENLQLPKMDMQLIASKDVGAAASSKGDKTPFELEVGLYGEMPLQRREGRGKMLSARGKLAQIEAKREFVINKVTTLVQDAMSALQTAAARIERAQTNLQLARETLTLGRERFNAGDLDLIELNIYELAVNDAQIILIEAHADFLIALANYEAALSVDPLPAGK